MVVERNAIACIAELLELHCAKIRQDTTQALIEARPIHTMTKVIVLVGGIISTPWVAA